MDVSGLVTATMLRARVDSEDDYNDLERAVQASLLDVYGAANLDVPDEPDDIPEDLFFAITDQATMLYDARGGDTDRPLGLSLAASRIVARHRGVSAG
ncbi:hypothetical protein [Celeribacter halophilus]|uniref:hypothetical protein n=1 Tax=Celeribacter halophilus TaxID=576117 RepID=UPI003A93F4C7